jgi:hypothetical protein
MKKIESVTAWKNGEQLEANLLNAYIINDNLESSCSFYYSLNAGGTIQVNAANGVSTGAYRIVVMNQFKN